MLNGSSLFKNGKPWLERFNLGIQQPQMGLAVPGQLVGWWRCIGNDSKRVVGTFTFFENEQTGFYGSFSATSASIDRRKRYTILGRNGQSLQMRWTNENGSSGNDELMLNGSSLFKNGKPWLERFNPECPAPQPGFQALQPGYLATQPQPGYTVQGGLDINGDGIPDVPATPIYGP